MKTLFIKIWILPLLVLLPTAHPKAQSFEIQQLLLDWQKLASLKNILKDMYKGYEILSQGYSTIRDISKGNFQLHQGFLDAMLQASPAVRQLAGVAEIVTDQRRIFSEYEKMRSWISQSPNFKKEDINYALQVGEHVLQESLSDLNHLLDLTADGTFRMSDAERLAALQSLAATVKDKCVFLQHFSDAARGLALQKQSALQNAEMEKSLLDVH